MVELIRSKLIVALLIIAAFMLGVNRGKNKAKLDFEKQKNQLLLQANNEYQMKLDLISKHNNSVLAVKESQNIELTKKITAQQERIKRDEKIINSTNHINNLFVRSVSETTNPSSVPTNTGAIESQETSADDFRAVSPARVASYIVYLKSQADSCVIDYNAVLDIYDMGAGIRPVQ